MVIAFLMVSILFQEIGFFLLFLFSPALCRYVAEDKLLSVRVSGVAEAFAKHQEGNTKGVKVHFGVDKSGLFHVEKSDVHFELQPEEVGSLLIFGFLPFAYVHFQPSTLGSIRDTISDMFSAFTGSETKPACEGDDCVTSGDDEQEPSATEKEQPQSEAPKSEEAKTEEPASEEKSDSTQSESNGEEKAQADKSEESKQDEQAGSDESKQEETTNNEKSESGSEENAQKPTEDIKADNETVLANATEKAAPVAPPKPKSFKETLAIEPNLQTQVDLDEKTFEAANIRLQALLVCQYTFIVHSIT